MVQPRVRHARVALALAGLVLTACTSGGTHKTTTAPTPQPTSVDGAIQGMVFVTGLSHHHVAGKVVYPTHPPMGGPHWPPVALGVYGWQQCAVYSQPVVDEFAVHSLEHGAVWLTYLPTLSADQVKQLDALDGIRPSYVLVSPYPGQKYPVMATIWGGQLGVSDASDPRLAEVVRTYAGGGQGNELGADCAHGSTLKQAQDALARAGG